MATSVEGNSSGKDLRGLSTLDEANLEKSILRRGLATAGEIEACKNHRSKLASKDKPSSPSLLEVMVDAKVLTRSQMIRLLQEKGERTSRAQARYPWLSDHGAAGSRLNGSRLQSEADQR